MDSIFLTQPCPVQCLIKLCHSKYQYLVPREQTLTYKLDYFHGSMFYGNVRLGSVEEGALDLSHIHG
jgi:hypothetical protein